MGWCNIQSKWKRRKISLELKAKTTLQHAYATYHYHDDDKDNDDTASDVTVAKDDDCFQHMLRLTEVYYMQSPVSRNNWHSLHWNYSFVGYLSVHMSVWMMIARIPVLMDDLCNTLGSLFVKPENHQNIQLLLAAGMVPWLVTWLAFVATDVVQEETFLMGFFRGYILFSLHFYLYVFWSVQLNSDSFAAVAATALTWKTSWPPQVRFLEDMLSHKIGHEIVNLFFFPYLHKAKTKS